MKKTFLKTFQESHAAEDAVEFINKHNLQPEDYKFIVCSNVSDGFTTGEVISLVYHATKEIS